VWFVTLAVPSRIDQLSAELRAEIAASPTFEAAGKLALSLAGNAPGA